MEGHAQAVMDAAVQAGAALICENAENQTELCEEAEVESMAGSGGVAHAQGPHTEEASRETREQYRQRFAAGGPVERPGASKAKKGPSLVPKPRL